MGTRQDKFRSASDNRGIPGSVESSRVGDSRPPCRSDPESYTGSDLESMDPQVERAINAPVLSTSELPMATVES